MTSSSIVRRTLLSDASAQQTSSSTDTAKTEIPRQAAIAATLLLGAGIEDRVKAVTINIMKAICADSNRRLAGCSKDPDLLNKGIFYSCEYFKALRSTGKAGQKRFDFLFKTGAFVHGFAPKKEFFIKESSPDYHKHSWRVRTGKVFLGYQIQPGISASNALKAMINGLSFLDCTRVCLLSYYYAIFELLGESRFNLLFANFNFEINNPKNLLSKVTKNPTSTEKEVDTAQIVYVQNMGQYRAKHPFGTAQGYNLLCIEPELPEKTSFLGFGLSESGVSYQGVKDALLREFNEATMADDIFHEKHKSKQHQIASEMARSLNDKKATEPMFIANEGGRIFSSIKLDFEKLDLLARASSDEEALSLFQRMPPRA
jgi:hypothetical protein